MKRPFSAPLWAIWYDQGGPAGDGGWQRTGAGSPPVYASRALAELALQDAKWSGKSPRIVELRGVEIPMEPEVVVKRGFEIDWCAGGVSSDGVRR